MKKFYCSFPVFLDRLNELSFEHYKLIVDVSDLKKRYFYFWLALFCRSDVVQLSKYIEDLNKSADVVYGLICAYSEKE